MDKLWLHNKWWYRLLQVIYCITFVFFLSFAVLIFLESKPTVVFDNENSFFKCDNGLEFNVGKLESVSGVYTYNGEPSSDQDNRKIRELCDLKKEEGRYVRQNDTVTTDNYKLVSAFKTESSWFIALRNTVLYISCVLLFFWIVRRVFLYILVKDNFLKL